MKIKEWYIRIFKVISIKDAEERNLIFRGNVYGDGIIILNCRSIWVNKKGQSYRVSELSDFKD